MRSRWWTRVGLFPLFGVVAAACGSDDFSGDRAASGDLDEARAGSAAAGAGQAEAIARASLRAAYVQAVQRSASEEYAIDRSDRVLRALNPSQGLRADFDVEEARVAPLVEGGAGWSWTVTPSRWGCADDLSPVSGAAPEASGNRVEYRREGLTEWYVNGPLGVEQGFTVPEAPACRRAGGGELVIELRAAEGLTTTLLHGDREAALEDASGEAVLRYMDLHVSDAEGKALPARLGLTEGRLSIRIEDAGAAYPLVVDPLVAAEWGKLVAADVNAWDQYGGAVALSGDTAIIGAPLNAGNSGSGAAYVFVRSGSTWAFQAKLAPGDGAADDNFGASVGIDGDIAIVGAPHDDDMGTDSGAAYVFVRSGAPPTWSQEKKLIPSGTASGHQFGRSVGVSADGVIVSGSVEQFYPGSGTSCASIFTGIGSTWSERKLISYGQCGPVAISGSTAVVSSGYIVDSFKIDTQVHCGVNGTGPRASSVAISGDTIVIGHDDEAVIGNSAAPYGVAGVYTSAGGCWTPQQSLFAGNGYDYFGHSVAIHEDRIVVGAHKDDDKGPDSGAAYLFVRSGSPPTWTQQQKLLASDGTSNTAFGSAVAISDSAILVGAPQMDNSSGAAYAFSLGLSPGDACTAGDQCASGFCADGVCCDTACAGTCSACTLAKKGSGADGVCGPIQAGSDPESECAADAPSSCGYTGACNGAGACQRYSGTVCAAATCSGSTLTHASTCDGGGTCAGNGTQSCGYYLCSGSACGTSCSSDGQCVSTAYCNGTSCAAKLASGAACSGANQCQSGFCVDGVCCNSACGGGSTGDCQACNVAGAAGTCSNAPSSTTCRASAGDCDVAETCTGASPACPADAYQPSGSTCRPSVGDCDVAEACTGASTACPADAYLPSGSTCRPSAGDCDVAEACTGTIGICPPDGYRAPGYVCRAQASDCDAAEVCSGGSTACPADGDLPDGAACTGGTCSGGACQSSGAQPWQVAGGQLHSLALDWDFNVWSWGSNSSGQLGVTGVSSRNAPGPVPGVSGIQAIAAGASHSMALSWAGDVWTWGSNASGQLGVAGTSLVPVQVPGLSWVEAIAGGGSHSMALVGGVVYTWGANGFGQLGLGSTTPTTTTVPSQVAIPNASGMAYLIAAGTSHSMAMDFDGVVWTWGRDNSGQLGNGAVTGNQPAPQEVSLPLGAKAIAAGGEHSMAVLEDNTIWTWGKNTNGQLGNSSTTLSQVPVQVVGLPAGSEPVLIAAGASHSLAVLSNGEVWAWGLGTSGQLGQGSATGSLVPVKVATLATALADPGSLAAGANHALAITAGASGSAAWGWGQDSVGQVGDGPTGGNKTSPAAVLFP